jgi:hypothetical protein
MGAELDQTDRQEMDEAFFECLGVESFKEQKALRERLYAEMRTLHFNKRDLELKAIENRRKTARGGEPTPESIAAEIWDEFDKTNISLFPDDFLGEYDNLETDELEVARGDRIVLGDSMFDLVGEVDDPTSKHVKKSMVLVDKKLYEFGTIERSRYAAACMKSGVFGSIEIPKDGTVCKAVLAAWEDDQKKLGDTFKKSAKERTSSDRDMNKVVGLLMQQAMAFARDQHLEELAEG